MKDIKWVGPLPKCDFCNKEAPYDSPTKYGPWANMCDNHMGIHGVDSSVAMRRIHAEA